jgi:hypothetical protein
MSKANASAKNRRAFNGNPPPPMSTSQPQPEPSQGFTLQQVISVIDRRLLNLESFMTESKENTGKQLTSDSFEQAPLVDNSITDILNEFNNRFDIIAEEVGTLKDIVLKLQSYTMDVNKTLLEERINVFSDLGNSTPPTALNINNQIFDITNVNTDNTLEEASNILLELNNSLKE